MSFMRLKSQYCGASQPSLEELLETACRTRVIEFGQNEIARRVSVEDSEYIGLP